MRAVALVALALLAAGCVQPPAADVQNTSPGFALPIADPMGQDHDQSDPTLHGVSWNFEQVAHDKVAGSDSHSAGSHALDLRGDWLFVAAYGGDADREGGVFIYDVKDPAAPKLTGRVQLAGSLGGDRSLEATEDADFAVFATEAATSFGHVNPTPPGLYLIDTRDKAAPKVAHFLPTGTGAHAVTIHRVAGKDYVFAGATGENSIVEIRRDPAPTLVPVGDIGIGHDAVAMDDPLLGKPLLYTANGFSGFEVLDISDPAKPQKVAAWNIPDRGDRYYVHHSAVQIIEDRRILVVTSEDWSDYPSMMWVLDATDLGDIQLLSNWTNPGGHPAEDIRYSIHNPRFLGSTLILSHYHGGVWALDLSTAEKRAAPPTLGVFLPHEDGGKPGAPIGYEIMKGRGRGFTVTDAPMTMDVEVHPESGIVYAADLHTGLYTLKPTW